MDRYSINARIYPVIIFCMPAFILATIFSLKFDQYTHLFTSLGIISALTYLFSQLSRDSGKKKEKELWNSWGGAPTTQILRWRNGEINISTKKRYHNKLNQLCPLDYVPDSNFEQRNPTQADNMYQTWTKFLLSKTRDTAKFSLIFKENMNYGFRRNLWGMKTHAITFILMLIISTYIYYWINIKSIDFRLFPSEFIIGEIILLFILTFWLIKIKQSWVRVPAFAYAEKLLESTEEL